MMELRISLPNDHPCIKVYPVNKSISVHCFGPKVKESVFT